MNKQTAAHIKMLELELLKPGVRLSKERMNELLAYDFFELAKDGKKYNKRQIIRILPQCPEEKFVTSKFEVKEISPHTALVTYIAAREVVRTKQKSRTMCSSIWQLRDKKWQLIFFQGTPMAE